ncbi:MAG: o-succinylbenzoate synthase [Bacteroidota bacterium]
MGLQASIKPHTLLFKKPATTSRGEYTQRKIYLLTLWNTANAAIKGVGECAPLKGLSIDDVPDYESVLMKLVDQINQNKATEDFDFDSYPSIKFGLETALLDLKFGGKKIIYQNFYAIGKQGIPINGLVWMDDIESMKLEVIDKIDKGFECIKIKIGALDFEDECRLLHFIRKEKKGEQLILRVDANGAFTSSDAKEKLKALKKYGLHSVEQPVKKGQLDLMADLCATSPVPIALDEELIGLTTEESFRDLLKHVKPFYLVLKPNLVGGFVQCEKWIAEANKKNIGWWITSALEGNIGLNAIAQYTANFNSKVHQGLGTGHLYDNNVPPYTKIINGFLWRDMGNEVSDNLISPDAMNIAN